MDIKKKLFYIFLFIQAFLWSILQLTRNIISLDSMEAITWGELLSFGSLLIRFCVSLSINLACSSLLQEKNEPNELIVFFIKMVTYRCQHQDYNMLECLLTFVHS